MFILLAKYCLGDSVQEVEMGGHGAYA